MNWQFWAVLSAVFAGITAVLAKVGVKDVDSNLATAIRTVVILPLTAAILFLTGEWRPTERLSGKAVLMLVLSGVATGLSWLCYNRALQTGPASLVAPIDKLSVALAIVLAWLLLGEPVSWRAALGGLLIVAVVIILALPGSR